MSQLSLQPVWPPVEILALLHSEDSSVRLDKPANGTASQSFGAWSG